MIALSETQRIVLAFYIRFRPKEVRSVIARMRWEKC